MKSAPNPNHLATLTLGALLAATTACSVSEQGQEGGKFPATGAMSRAPAAPSPRQQLKAVRTYAKTTFQLAAIDQAQVAGVDVRGALTAEQASQLRAASQADNVSLHLWLSVEARNASRDKVLLNQLEYEVLVNNREVASGSTDDVYEIGARSTLTIPITFTANVREALAAGLPPETLAAALRDWSRQPSRLIVRVRPTFQSATGRAFRTTSFEPIQAAAN